MRYFVDSSAVVKRYITEIGTPWFQSLMKNVKPRLIFVSKITGAEVIAAFSRRLRTKEISATAYHTAVVSFERDFQHYYSQIAVTDAVITNAMQLAKFHPLRGYDSVQLASTLLLKRRLHQMGQPDFTFISADENLCQIAVLEGLHIENPNLHS
ncbi:type II toxin-antitoxin system VapC family toxin [Candidatus Poribacteria bacterium]|nr:type II toxin-antitoxin system VapC family toxin [Candidatus Poribacteria bacterium]